jgi:hypothetical protein
MAKPPRKLERKQERFFSAHHLLLATAKAKLAEAEKSPLGRVQNVLIALSFASLFVEAYCNAVGVKMLEKQWDAQERNSPSHKVQFLRDFLSIISSDAEPWTTLIWLGKFRNRIAHPKPQPIDRTKLIDEPRNEQIGADMPKSAFENDLTLVNARRAIQAIESLRRLFFEKVPVDRQFGLYTDGWVSVTGLPSHA